MWEDDLRGRSGKLKSDKVFAFHESCHSLISTRTVKKKLLMVFFLVVLQLLRWRNNWRTADCENMTIFDVWGGSVLMRLLTETHRHQCVCSVTALGCHHRNTQQWMCVCVTYLSLPLLFDWHCYDVVLTGCPGNSSSHREGMMTCNNTHARTLSACQNKSFGRYVVINMIH